MLQLFPMLQSVFSCLIKPYQTHPDLKHWSLDHYVLKEAWCERSPARIRRSPPGNRSPSGGRRSPAGWWSSAGSSRRRSPPSPDWRSQPRDRRSSPQYAIKSRDRRSLSLETLASSSLGRRLSFFGRRFPSWGQRLPILSLRLPPVAQRRTDGHAGGRTHPRDQANGYC